MHTKRENNIKDKCLNKINTKEEILQISVHTNAYNTAKISYKYEILQTKCSITNTNYMYSQNKIMEKNNQTRGTVA